MDALSFEGEIHCKTLWISDVHLGSANCKAEHLIQLLDRVRCDRLYLVGDIVDMWAMSKRVFWPEAHNMVLRKLLNKSRAGVEIIYIPGNHDANFREFCGSEFGHVVIKRKHVHVTPDGRRLLVTHGDELDHAVRFSRINRLVGDWAYDTMMIVNRWVNKIRDRMGLPYWSLSGWIKNNVARAEAAIQAYQEAAVNMVREKGYDGIICGHLHHPVIQQYEDILYCNDGDWVENCTALLEDEAGQLKLLRGIASKEERTDVLFVAA
ncbi:MAG: UDP-2,3-diacylglucosamine diphosphatase [Halieaceae bacterium]|jgi:UDP-2,3-diacylglucosamine pyrophosphatase LpxH|nr:UDP-2,3-diacylglucosamine diphosphatase [Halieaceae bacterium]